MLHLTGNLLNDYYDHRLGVDRPLHQDAARPGRLLVAGQLQPAFVLAQAGACFVLATAAGAVVVWRSGPAVLGPAVLAVVLLYSYSGPPLRLKHRALGEGAIFLVFGPALMAGAAIAQTGRLELAILLASVPVGLATTAVLAGNNWRDRVEDAAGGIRTLGHMAGGTFIRALYVALVVLACMLPAAAALGGWAPRALLAAPLLLALLGGSLRAVLADRRLADIDARTARFAAALLVLMIAAWTANGR